MRTLCSGITVSLLVFAGLAVAQDESKVCNNCSTEANRTATTPTPGTYEYHVIGPYHRDGMLIFGTDEVSFVCENHPKDSMSWNYNVFKKVKTDPANNRITLVFHGGQSKTFTVIGGGPIAADLPNLAATRIAAAPRYHYGS